MRVFFINKVSLIKYSGTAQFALESIEKGTRQVVCVIYILTFKARLFCSSVLTVAKFISPWLGGESQLYAEVNFIPPHQGL